MHYMLWAYSCLLLSLSAIILKKFLLIFSQAIQKTRASEFGTCQRGEKFILRWDVVAWCFPRILGSETCKKSGSFRMCQVCLLWLDRVHFYIFRTGVQTFRREHDRFWVAAAHPTLNLFAAGMVLSLVF